MNISKSSDLTYPGVISNNSEVLNIMLVICKIIQVEDTISTPHVLNVYHFFLLKKELVYKVPQIR